MPAGPQNKTILEIINNCFSRLGLNAVSSLSDTRLSVLALNLINDVLADLATYGDWQEAYRTVVVTAQTSTYRYEVSVTAAATAEVVRSIHTVFFGEQTQFMFPRPVQEMQRWIRSSARGTPRHFAIIGVNGANPVIHVYPEPVTAGTEPFAFTVNMFAKHRIMVTADASIVPMYNARLVELGLYARLLLEEAGGEPTPQFQAATVEYERLKAEELNRFNYDTGESEVQFTIGSGYYS